MNLYSIPVETIDGFAHVTTDAFLPVWSNAISLANCLFFLIVFLVYLIGLVAFLFRISTKIKLVRNHKILFGLTVVFVLIQCLNLICRVVLDSLQMHGRILSESGQLVEWQFFVAIQVMGGITTFFMYINFLSLFQIMFFIQSMFWKTAKLMRAVSKKIHRIIEILMISINVIFVFISTLLILAVSVLYGIKKFEMVPTSIMTYLFPVFAVMVFFMFTFVIALVISSGVLVIRNIKQTTLNVTQSIQKNNHSNSSVRISLETQTFEKRVQSPFKITIGLMIGLVLCILLEIISVSLAAGVTSFEEIKAVWHFFNCLGVLIYSVLVLFLFYPLFLDSEKALKEIEKRNQIVKENSSVTKGESFVSTPVSAFVAAEHSVSNEQESISL